MREPENFNIRSQDLKEAYHDAGQIYLGRKSKWFEEKNIFEDSKAILLPKWRVQDIDTQEDWINAELMFNQINQLKQNKNKT